jgi:hypothetical protein
MLLAIAACGGGGSSSVDAAADSPKATIDAPHSTVDAPSSTVDAPPGGPTLTMKNYLAWCNVIVDGHAASTAAVQAVPVTAGTINVSATAASATFILGAKPWHDTAGDTGAGDPGTVTGTGTAASSATTVVVGASGKCIWICCPFANGTGCPTTDQCP